MLYNLPRKTAPVGLSFNSQAPAKPAHAEQTVAPTSLSFRRKIPDESNHSVSPSELTAALERYNRTMRPSDESETTAEEVMRKYKRARMDDALSRMPGTSFLPEAGPSNETRRQETATVKSEPTSTSDDESYWKGAFGQDESIPFRIVTEGTSQTARRVIFEYGRRHVQPVRNSTSSPPTLSLDIDRLAAALPHQSRDPEVTQAASPAADTASEDEGFAIVQRPRTAVETLVSLMSSPELVPVASIPQTYGDDETTTDDEWDMLDT